MKTFPRSKIIFLFYYVSRVKNKRLKIFYEYNIESVFKRYFPDQENVLKHLFFFTANSLRKNICNTDKNTNSINKTTVTI